MATMGEESYDLEKNYDDVKDLQQVCLANCSLNMTAEDHWELTGRLHIES